MTNIIRYRIWELAKTKELENDFLFLINKGKIYDYYKINYEFITPTSIPKNLEIIWVIDWRIVTIDNELIYKSGEIENIVETNSVFLKNDIEKQLSIIENMNYHSITTREAKEVMKDVIFLLVIIERLIKNLVTDDREN